MGNPLKDQPNVETADEDKEDMAPHLREKRKKGEPNPEQTPYDFAFENLRTTNLTEPGLPPDELVDCTFLMPPEEDGSRY